MDLSPKQRITRGLFLVATSFLISAAIAAQPTARAGGRMVYSPEARAIILFGGVTGTDSSGITYELDDTWTFSGQRWIQVYPEHSPSGRNGSAMVYDPVRNEVLLFGGVKDDVAYNDTWAYRNRDWTEIPTTNGPAGRRVAAAAFDSELGRTVLYGGASKDGAFFDTWEFDGTNWVRILESGPEIVGPSMVWDARNNELLLMGRLDDAEGTVKMFRYSGSAWVELVPETTPPCVAQATMIFDEHEQRVLFYGGTCNNGGRYSALYGWDGTNWTEIETALLTKPGQIGAYSFAYHPGYREAVFYGGTYSLSSFSKRTFVFRGGKWSELANGYSPGPRTNFVFAADPVDKVSWLYGGYDSSFPAADLWRLSNGESWQRVSAPGAPTDCAYPAGAWDPERRVLVVICENSLLYEFNGDEWISPTVPGDSSPLPARWRAMTWDPSSKRMALFGGYDGLDYHNELWYWNGSTWTKGEKKSPPDGRILSTFFSDPTSGRLVVFGGLGRRRTEDIVKRYDDMFSYDGSKWTAMTPSTKPSPRYGMQYGLDSDGSLIMFGGKNEEEVYINEVWKWNGTTWVKMEDINTPAPRMNGRLVLDPSTDDLTLYGGYAGLYYSQLWTRANGEWFLHPERGRIRGVVNPGDSASAPSRFSDPLRESPLPSTERTDG